MHDFLAYADARDTSLSTMRLLLWAFIWISLVAVMATVPIVVSRQRAHRHAGLLLAAVLFWALVAAGSACATLAARNQWASDDDVLLKSGFYDPREHRHDPPATPWALWGGLAGVYAGTVWWSLTGKGARRTSRAIMDGDA